MGTLSSIVKAIALTLSFNIRCTKYEPLKKKKVPMNFSKLWLIMFVKISKYLVFLFL